MSGNNRQRPRSARQDVSEVSQVLADICAPKTWNEVFAECCVPNLCVWHISLAGFGSIKDRRILRPLEKSDHSRDRHCSAAWRH